jgi:hypothetical protein
MSYIDVHGEITETVEYYDPSEWEAWKKGNHDNFPWDPRLAHSTYQQPGYYFGETHHVRKLLTEGFVCWQERYKLFETLDPKSRYYLYSEEIASLMKPEQVTELRHVRGRVGFALADPDIVAFHPKKNHWSFYEVKMPHDRLRYNQLCSLAILQRLIDATVGIVRFVPFDKARKTKAYEYAFRLCERSAKIDHPWPSRLRIDIGGHFGPSFSLELLQDSLVYNRYGSGYAIKQTEKLSVTNQQWTAFREALDTIDVWQWQAEYPNPGVMDGSSWSVTITFHDGVVNSRGDNNYPGGEGTSSFSPEQTPEFKRFLDAVRNLIRRREFR